MLIVVCPCLNSLVVLPVEGSKPWSADWNIRALWTGQKSSLCGSCLLATLTLNSKFCFCCYCCLWVYVCVLSFWLLMCVCFLSFFLSSCWLDGLYTDSANWVCVCFIYLFYNPSIVFGRKILWFKIWVHVCVYCWYILGFYCLFLF